MTYLVKQRPICAGCGKACGRRYIPAATQWDHERGWILNRDVFTKGVWDGVTWVFPYNPFCTLRCALRYARQMHFKHGTRFVAD